MESSRPENIKIPESYLRLFRDLESTNTIPKQILESLLIVVGGICTAMTFSLAFLASTGYHNVFCQGDRLYPTSSESKLYAKVRQTADNPKYGGNGDGVTQVGELQGVFDSLDKGYKLSTDLDPNKMVMLKKDMERYLAAHPLD